MRQPVIVYDGPLTRSPRTFGFSLPQLERAFYASHPEDSPLFSAPERTVTREGKRVEARVTCHLRTCLPESLARKTVPMNLPRERLKYVLNKGRPQELCGGMRLAYHAGADKDVGVRLGPWIKENALAESEDVQTFEAELIIGLALYGQHGVAGALDWYIEDRNVGSMDMSTGEYARGWEYRCCMVQDLPVGSLGSYIQQLGPNVDLGDVSLLLKCVLQCMQTLKKFQVVHNLLTPSSVFLYEVDGCLAAKIGDFSAAQFVHHGCAIRGALRIDGYDNKGESGRHLHDMFSFGRTMQCCLAQLGNSDRCEGTRHYVKQLLGVANSASHSEAAKRPMIKTILKVFKAYLPYILGLSSHAPPTSAAAAAASIGTPEAAAAAEAVVHTAEAADAEAVVHMAEAAAAEAIADMADAPAAADAVVHLAEAAAFTVERSFPSQGAAWGIDAAEEEEEEEVPLLSIRVGSGMGPASCTEAVVHMAQAAGAEVVLHTAEVAAAAAAAAAEAVVHLAEAAAAEAVVHLAEAADAEAVVHLAEAADAEAVAHLAEAADAEAVVHLAEAADAEVVVQTVEVDADADAEAVAHMAEVADTEVVVDMADAPAAAADAVVHLVEAAAFNVEKSFPSQGVGWGIDASPVQPAPAEEEEEEVPLLSIRIGSGMGAASCTEAVVHMAEAAGAEVVVHTAEIDAAAAAAAAAEAVVHMAEAADAEAVVHMADVADAEGVEDTADAAAAVVHTAEVIDAAAVVHPAEAAADAAFTAKRSFPSQGAACGIDASLVQPAPAELEEEEVPLLSVRIGSGMGAASCTMQPVVLRADPPAAAATAAASTTNADTASPVVEAVQSTSTTNAGTAVAAPVVEAVQSTSTTNAGTAVAAPVVEAVQSTSTTNAGTAVAAPVVEAVQSAYPVVEAEQSADHVVGAVPHMEPQGPHWWSLCRFWVWRSMQQVYVTVQGYNMMQQMMSYLM